MASQDPPVYVKKWMRTKHAIMFRLSNKIVQVNFQDHTEILLNSESRLVTYVNKKGERSTLPLNHALESSNAEMTKRLKYTKDILTHMLNNNNKGASTAPAMGGTGTGTGSSSRPGTISSAVTSKRSVVQSSSGAEGGSMPSTMLGKTGGTTSTTNILASDRRPLNVLN